MAGGGIAAGKCAQRLSASTEGTRASPTLDSGIMLCSTPFGINGRNTSWLPKRPTASGCAQRLSASTEGTRGLATFTTKTKKVLNAFRHQRKEHSRRGDKVCMTEMCSTPFGINGRNTTSIAAASLAVFGAQRLSASTEGTLAPRGFFVAARSCAQRLSASTEGTRPRRVPAESLCGVLNAFRHQRKEHEHRRWCDLLLSLVLNAFRHQRKEHGMLTE